MIAMSFVEKYSPTSLSRVIGQKAVIAQALEWLKKWKRGQALLIYGPTGTGKTKIAQLLAKDNGLDLIELTTAENRSAKAIKESLGSSVQQASLFKKGKLILIDEIDSLHERGTVTELIKIIKQSAFPMVLTADNAYNPKLMSLRPYCKLLKLTRIPMPSATNYLNAIAKKEKIKISESEIKVLAMNSGGDLRAALNDLEGMKYKKAEAGWREKERSIFETLKIIFKTRNIKTAHQVIAEYGDLDQIFWWIEQNVWKEYEKPAEIAAAFDLLSKANLFSRRVVRTQTYGLLKYTQDLLAAISLAKQTPYHKFVSYRPPDRLLILGRSKMQRAKVNALCATIGALTHCSKRVVRAEYLPYLKIIYGEDLEKFLQV